MCHQQVFFPSNSDMIYSISVKIGVIYHMNEHDICPGAFKIIRMILLGKSQL